MKSVNKVQLCWMLSLKAKFLEEIFNDASILKNIIFHKLCCPADTWLRKEIKEDYTYILSPRDWEI